MGRLLIKRTDQHHKLVKRNERFNLKASGIGWAWVSGWMNYGKIMFFGWFVGIYVEGVSAYVCYTGFAHLRMRLLPVWRLLCFNRLVKSVGRSHYGTFEGYITFIIEFILYCFHCFTDSDGIKLFQKTKFIFFLLGYTVTYTNIYN